MKAVLQALLRALAAIIGVLLIVVATLIQIAFYVGLLLGVAWLIGTFPTVTAWVIGIVIIYIIVMAFVPGSFTCSKHQMKQDFPELFKDEGDKKP